MWDKFHTWYVTNQDAITWFLIGVLFAQGTDEFVKGNYSWGIFLWFLAVVNYHSRMIRLR